MLKNKNFVLTVILPIFVSIIIGIIIIVLNSTSILHTRATANVENEKRIMKTEMASMKKEREALLYDAADYDKTLEDNRLLVEEVDALKEDLNDYNESIEAAKEDIEELDIAIEEKTAYIESLSGLTNGELGSSQSFTNVKLNIPTDLKAGRYTAEGTGTLMIYNIAGSLQDNQNLSLLDTHSYTFNISSGQSINIEGTLSLTEIIEQ